MDGRRGDASSLRDYLRLLRRRAWLVLLAAGLTPAAAFALSLRQDDHYRASAEVLLNRQTIASTVSGIPDAAAGQDPARYAGTQADLARVPPLAVRVLRAANLLDRSPAALLKSSSVTAHTDRDLLEFTVTDANKQLAILLAREYAKQYTLYRRQLDTAPIIRARAEMTARIAQLKRAGYTPRHPLYISLVEKEQQLKTLEALLVPAIVVRPAESATRVGPTPKRDVLVGLILGLLLGVGLALLWEALDTRVRTVEAVVHRLGLPLLARLPPPPRHLASKHELVMLGEPREPDSEPFRVLRTNLEFANVERGARTIMVTSALPGEGKSTTVANLAVALARAGRHVVLVDLDLRHPFLDVLFGLKGRPGLTHVVLGHVDLEDAIAQIPLAGYAVSASNGGARRNGRVPGTLEVLPAGILPPQPGEFVGARALDEILAQLATRAHFVLVDAPPLLGVGDSLTLSAKVDALFLVVRLNRVRRSAVDELRRVLATCPAAKLGFAVTATGPTEGYYESTYPRPDRSADAASFRELASLEDLSQRASTR